MKNQHLKYKNKKAKKVTEKNGLPPGSIYYIGNPNDNPSQITIVSYSKDEFSEIKTLLVEDCFAEKDSCNVNWINIDGIHNTDNIEKIGLHYKLHPLLLEDIVNTEQRPKLEEYDNALFLTLKLLSYNTNTQEIDSEHVSFVLTGNTLISFQENNADSFELLRKRIEAGKGTIRAKGTDYLLYSLLDVVVDNYFSIIENISETIENLEEELFENPNQSSLQTIQNNKKDFLILRKAIYPLRESIYKLQNNDSNLIKESTAKYFRDVYDHTIQIIENIENYRDINLGLKDIYLSSISLKMNRIMQVLTIISTIFIPLTFIVGLYGMNFDFMPELHWRYGYFFVWGVIVVVTISLTIAFKRKKWF
ncbi:MAG: magnesium/cobalt transporter CorA [Bacteroidota bacterium]